MKTLAEKFAETSICKGDARSTMSPLDLGKILEQMALDHYFPAGDVDEFHCPFCGAALKKHWHSLTKGLVRALIKIKTAVIMKGENKVHPRFDANFTANEWSNLSKLRFHALIAKSDERGYWLLTHRGSQFLLGKMEIPKRVLTWRNKVVDYDPEKVFVKDVVSDSDLPVWEEHHEYELAKPDDLAGSPKIKRDLFE
jgi:hypothetical protein